MRNLTKGREFWFFAAFFILTASLLTYGLLTHEEAGFTSETTWPGIPVHVSCSGPEPADCATVADAVDAVNDRLGFTLFGYGVGDAFIGADGVSIQMGVPHESGWDTPEGHFRLTGEGGHWRECRIQTSNVPTEQLLFLIAQHELLHCAGLGHDDFPGSIMSPEFFDDYELADLPRITDSDRIILRERYRP